MNAPRSSLLVSSIVFVAGCGAASIDGRFTRNAIDRAAQLDRGAEVAAIEAPGGDGSVYRFEGKAGDKLCFTGTIDNRDARARDDRFRVRLFAEEGKAPLTDLEGGTEIVGEREVAQPGAVRTGTYVVGPDGAPAGEMIELGTVGYPVADVRVCFDGIVDPVARYVVLNRLPKTDERSAPSYAGWKR